MAKGEFLETDVSLGKSPLLGIWQSPDAETALFGSKAGNNFMIVVVEQKTVQSVPLLALAGLRLRAAAVVAPPLFAPADPDDPEALQPLIRSAIFLAVAYDPARGVSRLFRMALFPGSRGDVVVNELVGPTLPLSFMIEKVTVNDTSGEIIFTTVTPAAGADRGMARATFMAPAAGAAFTKLPKKNTFQSTLCELDAASDLSFGAAPGAAREVPVRTTAAEANAPTDHPLQFRQDYQLAAAATEGIGICLSTGILDRPNGRLIYRGSKGGFFTIDPASGQRVFRTAELAAILEKVGFFGGSAASHHHHHRGGGGGGGRGGAAGDVISGLASMAPEHVGSVQTNVFSAQGRMIFVSATGSLFTVAPGGARVYSPEYKTLVDTARAAAAADLVLDEEVADPRVTALGIENPRTHEMIFVGPDGALFTPSDAGAAVQRELKRVVQRGCVHLDVRAPEQGAGPVLLTASGAGLYFRDEVCTLLTFSQVEQMAYMQQIRSCPTRTGVLDPAGREVFVRPDGQLGVVAYPAPAAAGGRGGAMDTYARFEKPAASFAELVQTSPPLDGRMLAGGSYRAQLFPDRVDIVSSMLEDVVESLTPDDASGAGAHGASSSAPGQGFRSFAVDATDARLYIAGRSCFWELASQNAMRDTWLYHLLRREFTVALSTAPTAAAVDTARRCLATALYREGQLVRAAEAWALTSAPPEHVLARLMAHSATSVLTLPGDSTVSHNTRLETGLYLRDRELEYESPVWYDRSLGTYVLRDAEGVVVPATHERATDAMADAAVAAAEAVVGVAAWVREEANDAREIITGVTADRISGSIYVVLPSGVVETRMRTSGAASQGLPIECGLHTAHGLRLLQSVATPGGYFCVDSTTGAVAPLPEELRAAAASVAHVITVRAEAAATAEADAAVGMAGALRRDTSTAVDTRSEAAAAAYLRRRLAITPDTPGRQDRTVLALLLLDILLKQYVTVAARNPAAGEQLDREVRALLDDSHAILPRRRVAAMLNSLGLDSLVLHWAKVTGDYGAALNMQLAACNFPAVVDCLVAQRQPELWYRLAPRLMRSVPTLFVDRVSHCFGPPLLLDPVRLLPGVASYAFDPEHGENQAIRLLRVATGSSRPDWHVNCSSEVLHNFLIQMLAEHAYQSGEHAALLDFIFSSERYDPRYALRVCSDFGEDEAVVRLLSRLGLYSEAVQLALALDDVTVPLSKSTAISDALDNAALAPDLETQRRLTARVVGHVIVKRRKLADALRLVARSNGRLALDDILPAFPDFTRLDEFRDAVVAALGDCASDIDTARSEITATSATAALLRAQLDDIKRTFLVSSSVRDSRSGSFRSATDSAVGGGTLGDVASLNACGTSRRRAGLVCPACDQTTATAAVDTCLFPCGHSYHVACLRESVLSVGDRDVKERVRLAEAAVALAETGSRVDKAQAEAGLLDALTEECPLCALSYTDWVIEPINVADTEWADEAAPPTVEVVLDRHIRPIFDTKFS